MAVWVRNKRTGLVWPLDEGTWHTRYVLGTGEYDLVPDPAPAPTPPPPASAPEKPARASTRRKR